MQPLRTIGLILMLVGFLAGAFFSVRKLDIPAQPETAAAETEAADLPSTTDPTVEEPVSTPPNQVNRWYSVEWQYYIPAILVGIAGVAILRYTASRAGVHSEKLDSDMNTMRTCLDRLVKELESIVARYDATKVNDVHHRIDNEMAGDLAAFADARESIIHVYGLEIYAEVMTQFAAAERVTNRAWSASADGYADEVKTSLDKALTFMTAARQKLQNADNKSID